MSVRTAFLLLLAAGVAACGASATAAPEARPPGADTDVPFPIDRGDDGAHTPGTYKGLWLRLAASGEPAVTAVDGIIGVVCVGMSNAFQECGPYAEQVRGAWATVINPQVRVVNCAVGGRAIESWNDPAFDDVLWDACIALRLSQAGIRLDQVRVIYHKAANQFTLGPGNTTLPTYPAAGSDYARFVDNLDRFAARVPVKFPAVQAVYTSSRSYGGFAPPQRGEPLSYEEGHALNSWLRDNPSVAGVWQGWGPYLWAGDCGTGLSNATGLCYVRSDFVADGVHPSLAGQAKIASAIHQKFLQHRWYRR